jgi:hypothetical protein
MKSGFREVDVFEFTSQARTLQNHDFEKLPGDALKTGKKKARITFE